MADEKLCAVGGCCKPIINRRGYCSAHYRRLLRHGDPTKGNADHGAGDRWLKEHTAFSGDECLIWPFSKSTAGYAYVRVKPKRNPQSAARVMCEWVKGPPPAQWYQAAHSCGNGSGGCVNPKHLNWKTPADNHADKRGHGTLMAGGSHYNAKLSDEDVAYIRSMKGAVVQRQLAEQFGVSHALISSIINDRQRRQ